MDTTTPAPTKTTAAAPKRTTYKGAENRVEYLIKEKVPYLFGVCGHGNIGCLDATCNAANRIKTISVHHAQAVSYMADAYYKVKHQPVATYTARSAPARGNCRRSRMASRIFTSSRGSKVSSRRPGRPANFAKETVMRSLLILGFGMVLAGCGDLPRQTDVSELQMRARDNGVVYYGTIQREYFREAYFRTTSLTLEVDRRVYSGNIERTSPNATFGLYRLYGARDAAPKSAETLSQANFRWAILSSADKRTMNCDFIDFRGRDSHGICIDHAQRVYDAVLYAPQNEEQDLPANERR
ncbi:MAG: thiamine pyrophosphate-binding protein [Burkholderiales bacterium]